MLQLVDIAKNFGARQLFSGVTWHVDSHPRVALIGPNGSGKSTLLKMIAGELAPDDGDIRLTKGMSVGYLAQEVGALDGETPLDVVMRGRRDLLDMAAQLAALEDALAQGGDTATLATLSEEHGTLQSRYEL